MPERKELTSMKTALTIAGSDPIGGAGIQADIKTMSAHRVYAMSAVTALTAQNTLGVFGLHPLPPAFVQKQLTCVFEDIPPDAVKIGMLVNEDVTRAVAQTLRSFAAQNIVVDPVMLSTSGARLLSPQAARALTERIFPLASVITPNIPEAEALSGMEIRTRCDRIQAARRISALTPGAVLIKGGHAPGADDLLYMDGQTLWLTGERIDNPDTHGTGCTLSSAIACNLALGRDVRESVRRAKDFVTNAIRAGLHIGRGRGPLDHGSPNANQGYY